MKNKILLLAFAVSALAFGQTVPINVQKTAGTNAITADLVVGSGHSLTPSGTGSIGATTVTYAASVTETSGTGSPEGVVTANIGSVFHRTNGSSGTTLYIKESGTGNTGWVAVTSGGGGSGTVNSGTANQLAYYAGTGTAVSGLTTTNNGIVVTDGSGVPSVSNVLPSFSLTDTTNATSSTTGSIKTAGGLGVAKDIWFGSSNFLAGGFARLGGASASGSHLIDAQTTTDGTVAFGAGDLAGSGPTFYFTYFSSSFGLASRNGHAIKFQIYSPGAQDVLTLNTDLSVTVNQTTTSTSSTTGALTVAGGVGVAENINAGGNIVTQTIGKTLGVKSGSNAKAGTFTLSSGAATLSNTSITANSVLVCWLKTASGAITSPPYATAVSVGTSYTIAGGAGDNSTYNYVILEVN